MLQVATVAYDIRTGGWSEPELDLLPLALQAGETALDIGANYGQWMYHLSKAVGPSGQVIAFEPVPSTFQALAWVRQLFRLTNVRVVPSGCGDIPGPASFTVPLQQSGAVSAGLAYISSRRIPTSGTEPPSVAASVDVSSDIVVLDQSLEERANLAFIKCDVEGAEVLVFRGAEQLVEEQHPTVVCEISDLMLAGFGFTADDLSELFFRHGYRKYHYDRGRSHPLWEVIPGANITWHNYVFIHPSRLDRFSSLLE